MAGKTTKKGGLFDTAADYTITSKLSGKAITACGDIDIRMFSPTGAENQQWKLLEAAGGAYRLLSKATGKAMDIILAGENDGAQLHQWEDLAVASQCWKIEQTQDGCCKIKSALSGKCLDIVDISMLDDARLQIWEDLDGDNQKWELHALNAPKPARKPRAAKKADAPAKPAQKEEAQQAAASKPTARKTAAAEAKPAPSGKAAVKKAEEPSIAEKTISSKPATAVKKEADTSKTAPKAAAKSTKKTKK